MCERIKVSPLAKTWILDLYGTVVKHNGYKLDGADTLLPGAEAFFRQLPPEDMVVFLTSRPPELAEATEAFLTGHGVRYDAILYGAPYGERILVNDRKPSGLSTAIAVNTVRDRFMEATFETDEAL